MVSLGEEAGKINGTNGKAPGWFAVRKDIFDDRAATMGPFGFTVYCALLRHADEKGRCWPSLARLSKITGISRVKIIGTLRALQGLGFVTKKASADHRSNVYIVHFAGSPREPGVVHGVNQGSTPGEPGVVHGVNWGSTRREPERDSLNETLSRRQTWPVPWRLRNRRI